MTRRHVGPGPFDGVRPEVEAKAREWVERFRQRKIPHALIGGLAFNVYGRPRATKDVDFLLPSSAAGEFPTGGELLGATDVVTIRDRKTHVDTDFLIAREDFLEDALVRPPEVDGVPVVRPEPLVFLKMEAGRRRDVNDVLDMIEQGLDVDRTRRYLERYAPDKVQDFDQLVLQIKLGFREGT